ncbi:hypothetical protein A2917_02000 [Candidatus Nomurabacteria bacterium RIFCSPLOWO2_01_FULL_42_17]|uniref:Uncharacterized protein n=1 Tax=Candidatus Nomurabacteria bacterium RIFCSPLOWO2_01_FULL_42_17 TaxID=1801780 RepID=A0A1F6XMU4_9BACT|nr:MAG: hypothetical protein A2917_02000 [Candidatus Nomurabacteria bacterium RIFCSPLOWO2_01_FULL_42_17]
MIYLLLILFFASLVAIIIMIGRKLAVIEHEQILNHEEVLFEIPNLEKVKHFTIRNLKKYGHAGLVGTMRLYLKSKNFLRNKYEQIKIKINKISNETHVNGEKREISKFLKVIGDYKHKIREIQHKIKKEENL